MTLLRDGKSMRSKSNFQKLRALSKCMFRILAVLCFSVALMAVGSLVLIENTEAVRAALSDNAMRTIRKILKFFFQTASVYESLQIIFTALVSVLIVVSFFTCIFSACVCIITFFMNISAKCRVSEEYASKYSQTVLTNYERLFLLFGRIRV